MKIAQCPLPLLAATALLAGCAAPGPFPSLAPRVVEREFAEAAQPASPCLPAIETAAPPPAAVEIPNDPSLEAHIDRLLESARQGGRAFEEAMSAARPAVSGAGAAGSESWIAAQIAVSRAETARTPTVTALADLTALALERAAQPTSSSDRQALEAALSDAQALADQQVVRLEEIKRSLRDL